MSERPASVLNGYLMLVVGVVLSVTAVVILYYNSHNSPYVGLSVGLLVIAAFMFSGLFVVNPNEAKVIILFGSYVGSMRKNGFFWVNPFFVKKNLSLRALMFITAPLILLVLPRFIKKNLSLRARNLSGEKLKVNDKIGNPIEIAAVIVWQVDDTFKAAFEVDDYEQYVIIQSEAAVRHLAQSYPYDSFEDEGREEGLTLRSSADQVNKLLEGELQERLNRAGVKVIEARLSHLAYAPEIAEAMLRRQQASAVVAARTRIVQGAVSMVEMALNQLSERHLVELDEERRASMVSNLLVVLCSESAASPVINTGTLYQ